jgi:hypothetical protein
MTHQSLLWLHAYWIEEHHRHHAPPPYGRLAEGGNHLFSGTAHAEPLNLLFASHDLATVVQTLREYRYERLAVLTLLLREGDPLVRLEMPGTAILSAYRRLWIASIGLFETGRNRTLGMPKLWDVSLFLPRELAFALLPSLFGLGRAI